MEEIPVAIVGAGPAGLVLALSLARHEIHVSKVDNFILAKGIPNYTT
jgi:2-polyprenyl-6-methoxyphenol hydroxylase-like FAD-dependent oxidoreductase